MKRLKLVELVWCALLGALLLAGDLLMEALPNVHLVGVLLTVYTVVFRAKALFPLYVYVLLLGFTCGFATWWIPYLYIWLPLWGAVLLLPRNLPPRLGTVLYGSVCMLHGLSFGTLYAPAQVLLFHLPWEALPGWIAAGLIADSIHAAGNAALSVLIVPLITALRRAIRHTP